MKGMKALEFKLWSKAKYFNDKEKINKVFKINKILVKLHKQISLTFPPFGGVGGVWITKKGMGRYY